MGSTSRTGRFAFLRPRRRAGQLVESVEEREVPVGLEGLDHSRMCRSILGPEILLDPGSDRPSHGRSGEPVQFVYEPGLKDLGVPGVTECAGQPLQLVADRLGHIPVQQWTVRRQGIAQAARRDPHLVDAAGEVLPHQRVPPPKLGDLVAQAGLDDDARGVLLPGCLGGSGVWGREPVADRTRQFRPCGGRSGSGVREQGGGSLQQGVVALGQLDLPLAPSGLPGLHLSGDEVVGHDREQPAGPVEQPVLGAVRAQRGNRPQRLVTHEDPYRVPQPLGHGGLAAAKPDCDLVPRPVGRQLQVPAVVGATGTSPNGDPGRGQPQVRRVEVRRLEPMLRRLDRRDLGQSVERRQDGVGSRRRTCPRPRGGSAPCLSLLLCVAVGHDRLLVDRAAPLDGPRQPDQTRVRPGQRGCGPSALTGPTAGRGTAVPDLLGEHVAGAASLGPSPRDSGRRSASRSRRTRRARRSGSASRVPAS